MNVETVFEFIKNKRGYDFPSVYKIITGRPLLKDDLVIKDDLDISFSDITSLPDNLTIKGDLNIIGCEFESLPDNLTVKEYLFIENTKIDSIPKNLIVSGGFFVKNTPLSAKYSKDMIKKMVEDRGGKIYGGVY